MKIGTTFDLREDYGIDKESEVFADFCSPYEIDALARAIEQNGHTVRKIGNMYKLRDLLRSGEFDCDLVFVEDEGLSSRNREAVVPALLELYGIPYVGSDAYAMALSQNKYHTKLVCRALDIRVPEDLYLTPEDENWEKELGSALLSRGLAFPLVVKPNEEGYSMGVFLVSSLDELIEKIRYDFDHYRQPVLIERMISGPELYVPVIGTGREAYTLGAGECRYNDGREITGVFTLRDKCFEKLTDSRAQIDRRTEETLNEWALRLHRHLCCRDFSRADFKLDENGVPYLLEINPRPGMTRGGPFEACAQAAGKSYEEIIGEIIDSAARRYPALQK